jgi:hypothetical protein
MLTQRDRLDDTQPSQAAADKRRGARYVIRRDSAL